ncbi:hypothetical protein [Paenibacillus motobuensis]
MLQVDTSAPKQQGITFYDAGNEVCLSDHVPPGCLSVLKYG